MKQKKLLIPLLAALLPAMVMLNNCRRKSPSADPRGPAYAGAQSCESCHKEVYNSYIHTAHYFTSHTVSRSSMHGNFSPGFNSLVLAGGRQIAAQRIHNDFYQVGYEDGRQTEAHQMDLAIGGVKAETYLYWKNNQLFELPLTWFNGLHSWVNSPGYAPDQINFDRPVAMRCLECHGSYIKQAEQLTLRGSLNSYDRKSLIAGIDCERCHGPAAQHVVYHEDHPEEKQAHFIGVFSKMSRARKLDACAVCHGGNNERFITSAFNFKTGDTLANFKEPGFDNTPANAATLDVHGNQNGLLAGSKCFLMSNMDCTTCHDTHVSQRNQVVLFADKCMQCHNTANHNNCKMAGGMDAGVMKSKCIDCHMPAMPSDQIGVQTATQKKALPYLVRTHRIAVYADEAKKILAFVRQGRH
ncbi:putative CXXCH cytochrome family protein [Mucilaginibacter yixingensis]|uniref:Putative CXXCH cytochrome family protein n=1 Tax=Mucilaginibacter yixingensis TaxID=1295612 RepID=A0A2T5JDW5_9SPHI|nr:multiheme c-type cytochrome [Mucilaginibacter yixingensis]PTQ99961.1 putative CXXCH cytochrome family protein [Mucilaginibacter yixingensis]